ncbi:hypothetical protein Cgig2_013876 [Carnegiea gigantea]|uniref:Uncharacterized protein n=1 Tax=Carnegiea gigantea TaxID=171969 RepID=A0A9Q1GKF0_9CARY|nr:hypothetical protein Cgig2_013876 [Carnegiea gigantea]
MDQLQSELRLARSVISDKDAEIQRVRTTNNQYLLVRRRRNPIQEQGCAVEERGTRVLVALSGGGAGHAWPRLNLPGLLQVNWAQPALSQPGIVQAAQRLSLLVGINTGAWKANPDQAIQVKHPSGSAQENGPAFRLCLSHYVEENERLRAILGEWSARTAKVASIPFLVITYKLERALEMEHISNLELQRKLAAVRSHYAEQTQQH